MNVFLIFLALTASNLVSEGKPYSLNAAPVSYPDSKPQKFTAIGQQYRGELTDGIKNLLCSACFMGWTSREVPAEPVEIIIDLGDTVKNIHKVTQEFHRTCRIKQWSAQFSTDSLHWSEPVTRTDSIGINEDKLFQLVWIGHSIDARFVKFSTIAEKFSFLMISELEVWVTDTSLVDTTTVRLEKDSTDSLNK